MWCYYLMDGEQSGDEAGGGREAHGHHSVAVGVSAGHAVETPQETSGGGWRGEKKERKNTEPTV